jgi:hypothetical protein
MNQEQRLVAYYASYAQSAASGHVLHVTGEIDHNRAMAAVVAYAEAFCGLWTGSPVDTTVMDRAFGAANMVAAQPLPTTATEAREQDAMIDAVLAGQAPPFNWFE